MNTLWASFDIGKCNFAFYIEELDMSYLQNISNLPKNERYNKDGSFTEAFSTIIQSVTHHGKTVLCSNNNITQNCAPNSYIDQQLYYNLFDLLDSYSSYWDRCEGFVIEQQMNFGRTKQNPMAFRLMQHTMSYFMFRYGRFKKVIEFPSYFKTQILGATKIKPKNKYIAMTKPMRKKWSIAQTIEISASKQDELLIQSIANTKKKDDIADTFMQLQAFKYLFFVDKSI